MMTLSGVLLNRENEAAPTLRDMAIGLSRIPRFGGQTLLPWTVGQHLLACAAFARKRYPIAGLELHVLLHDAHEAMTSDIPTSWKTPDMRTLQKDLDRRIYASLALPLPDRFEAANIAEIDRELLLAEAFAVTPRATYQRICEEVGYPASFDARVVVGEVLNGQTTPADVADLWQLRVTSLLRHAA